MSESLQADRANEVDEPAELPAHDTLARILVTLALVLSVINSVTNYLQRKHVDHREVVALLDAARDDLSGDAIRTYVLAWTPKTQAERASLERSRRKIVKALSYEPDNEEAIAAMGIYYAKLGDTKRATDWLSRAPHSAKAHSALGTLLRLAGKWQDAESEYKEALRIDPTLQPAHLGLGFCLGTRNEAAAAIKSFEKCIEIDATYAPCYVELGNLYVSLKQPEAASVCYDRCIAIDDTFETCYGNNIALALLNNDRKRAELLHAQALGHGIKLPPLQPEGGVER